MLGDKYSMLVANKSSLVDEESFLVDKKCSLVGQSGGFFKHLTQFLLYFKTKCRYLNKRSSVYFAFFVSLCEIPTIQEKPLRTLPSSFLCVKLKPSLTQTENYRHQTSLCRLVLNVE